MVQQPPLVVEAKQQRSDEAFLVGVPKAADHTVSRTDAFHLEHGSFAWLVSKVEALGHDTVEGKLPPCKPTLGLAQIAREEGSREAFVIARKECLKLSSTLLEGSC